MQDFKIDVNDISWLDGKIKNKWDLCAHGPQKLPSAPNP